MDPLKTTAEDLRGKPLEQLVGLAKEWRKRIVEDTLAPLKTDAASMKIRRIRKGLARLETVVVEKQNANKKSK